MHRGVVGFLPSHLLMTSSEVASDLPLKRFVQDFGILQTSVMLGLEVATHAVSPGFKMDN
jgi:hypothetical protein